MLNRRIVASKSNTNLFISHFPLPCWWRRCRLSLHIIPQNRGECKGLWSNSRRGKQKWCIATRYDVFASLKMMLLHYVSQWCDVCHKMWRSHASLGIVVIIGRSPTSFAEGKHHWKKPSAFANGFFLGRGRRARTHDPRFWRPVLYQLSYTPIFVLHF